MALVLLICLGGIVCLSPLAVYLRWISSLNRRPRPAVVPGSWDVVALLAGLSGFLLFGGGLIVALAQSNARILLRGNREQFESVVAGEWRAWAAVAAAYVLTLVGAAGLAVLYRSRALSVYNVDRDRADAAVDGALADLGIPAARDGDLWSHGDGLVEVQPFEGFRHVTVWFVAEDLRRRQAVERAVRARLDATPGAHNPAVPYLVSAATTVGCAALSFVLMIAYLVYSVAG